MKPISEYMVPSPVRIQEERTVAEAIQLMREKGIGALIVEGGDHHPTGIFTERDLLTKLDIGDPLRWCSLPIRQTMTGNLITVSPEKSYTDVIQMMERHKIRHMPVMKDDQIIGIVSLRDLLRRYEENLEHTLQQKEKQLLENISKIKESEERFRSIFHNSAVGITFADNSERIIAWNRLATELLGMDEQELLDKPVHDLYPPEEWEKIRSFNIRQLGREHHMETKVIHKDGRLVEVDLSVSVLKDNQGKIMGSIGIMKDITERKKYERELQAVNKELADNAALLKDMVSEREKALQQLRETQQQMIQIEKMATLGTLAAGFAHEVKNPLGIILQGTERLEKFFAKQPDNNGQLYINAIKKATDRANRVVTTLLKYSRSSRLEVRPVNIYEVIEEAMELGEENARIHNVEFRKDYVREDRLLDGDPIMLQQVFFDLFTNAFDAMPKGGTITVSISFHAAEGSAGTFVIKVSDTGIGIPAELLPKVFDPFVTTKDEGKGTGLGLSMVYLILERHNGTIKVDSAVGKGTTFIITLPAGGATEIQRRYQHV